MTTTRYTGGLKKFVYKKGDTPKLTVEEGLEIDKAYEKVRIRKRKEKIRKWIILGVIILVVIIIYLILK